jgi:hypothetical protein
MSSFDDDDATGAAASRPPWLVHLAPEWLAWREKQILKGRDPDPYIERKLIEAGVLPEDKSLNGAGK